MSAVTLQRADVSDAEQILQMLKAAFAPLLILPQHQNRGYAQAAMHEAERLHGAENWELSTIMQEQGNCHLYEKMGYHRTGVPQTVNARMTLVQYEKD